MTELNNINNHLCREWFSAVKDYTQNLKVDRIGSRFDFGPSLGQAN